MCRERNEEDGVEEQVAILFGVARGPWESCILTETPCRCEEEEQDRLGSETERACLKALRKAVPELRAEART